MFIEIFSHLPLFAIINKSVFVVHGGLFRCNDITMGDLARLNRQEYSLANMPEYETLDAFPRYRSSDFSNQVVRDALWSDPHESLHGLGANTRGAGVAFGADVTLEFLERNNLKMVIRSHECIRDGYCQPYTGELSHLLCTIFSASNYMYNNSGAYMVFRLDSLKSNAFVHKASHAPSDGNLKNYIADSDLYYTVHFFNIDESEARFDDSILYATPSYEDDLGVTLYELVLRQKSVLLEEFIRFDPAGTGIVSKPTWAEVMKCVIKLHIRWLTMVDTMVNPIAFEDINGTIMIRYQTFLDTFSATLEPSYHHGVDKNDSNSIFVEAFYSQHKKLEAVFRFFDRDCDGIISSEEFKTGCRIINETLVEHERLTDIDRILSLLDTDQSNCIDVNEFFEMFRYTYNTNTNANTYTKINTYTYKG
jgi:Ca2+-binding EF-hand superfamily protein/diadenosine tetraphosphatase ApaH/serine/threonine PP2A family protein phosphatase